MALLQNEPNIVQEEHDNTFGLKKVGVFKDDGLGNVVREAINSLNIGVYDYLSFGYNNGNLTTIGFYNGGVGGTLLNTLTFGYDGSSNLTSIAKS